MYWGNNQVTQPVAHSGPGRLKQIAQSAFNTPDFQQGRQEDAHIFYTHLMNELKAAPTNPTWDLQHETLYSVTLRYRDQCTACNTVNYIKITPDETSINVGVLANHTSLDQAIHDSLTDSVDYKCASTHCNNTNQRKDRRTEIVAAPKILRVRLSILLWTHKIFNHLTYPSVLDLTTYQQNATLPLMYRLSSVIARHGDYVEGGGGSGEAEEDNEDEDDIENEDDDEDGDDDEEEGEVEEEEEVEEEDEIEATEEGDSDENENNENGPVILPKNYNEEEAMQQAIAASEGLLEGGSTSTNSNSPVTPYASKATGKAKPSKSTSTKVPPKKKAKKTQGHYIASVLEPDGSHYVCDDASTRSISQAQFTTNPQTSDMGNFEVYILTYIRDDSGRMWSGRWLKGINGLVADGESGSANTSQVAGAGATAVAGAATYGATVRETRALKRKRGMQVR